jgi:hypothetical protein
MKIRAIALAIGFAVAAQAHAADVFSDNFDNTTQALNATDFAQGWVITNAAAPFNGTVDVIGAGGQFDFLPGHGNYVDLDGSTQSSGVLQNSVQLTAGVTYTLSFSLAGDQRNAGPDNVDVHFGDASGTFSRGTSDGFSTSTLTFTPTQSGSYAFNFHDLGNDNQGALLDNVRITSAVPEPATGALLLAGLGLMGFVGRRRRG